MNFQTRLQIARRQDSRQRRSYQQLLDDAERLNELRKVALRVMLHARGTRREGGATAAHTTLDRSSTEAYSLLHTFERRTGRL